MPHAKNVAARIFLACALVFGLAPALANDCIAMAELAHDVAKLRDAGVPIAAVESRLRREVRKPDELAMSLTVVRLVYRTEGSAQGLKDAVLSKCKPPNR